MKIRREEWGIKGEEKLVSFESQFCSGFVPEDSCSVSRLDSALAREGLRKISCLFNGSIRTPMRVRTFGWFRRRKTVSEFNSRPRSCWMETKDRWPAMAESRKEIRREKGTSAMRGDLPRVENRCFRFQWFDLFWLRRRLNEQLRGGVQFTRWSGGLHYRRPLIFSTCIQNL